ncbi:hypothetical protein [uncultured Cetobacterium sp.]|uniref:hypothetical protein n=1 Tax=uncultured Cetobacterium sp. TaxID=527638 RepID=UPI00260EB568|nr:hypothetical protein [uncultured Cetobacterium sp.]
MPSDRSLFNCKLYYEHDYIIRQYAISDRTKVAEYLKKWCDDNTILCSTYAQIYSRIKSELGLVRK